MERAYRELDEKKLREISRSDLSDGGSRFWVTLQGGSFENNFREWCVTIRHTRSDWSGSITSRNPGFILEARHLSGLFSVDVVASGSHFKEKSLTVKEGSDDHVVCDPNCTSMIGIGLNAEGSGAFFWTVSNAICGGV